MRMVYDLLRLHFEEGASGRRIAESLGISRDTVADYLMRARFAGITWPLPVDADDAALKALLFPVETSVVHRKPMPDWAEVHKAMQKSGATLTALHEEYLAQHPDGMARSYFCQCYAEWRQGLRSYMRQTHVAGERVAVDYSGMLMQITGPGGEQRSAQIFVGVLGASSLTYVEAHWSQRLPDWIAAHVRMFEYFGCTPKVVVCDNLKAAVTKASRTEPQINDTYQHLARHYSMTVLPTRARKPKDKSKVENGVRLIQRWILFKLRHETFSSLEQLNAAIRPLLETLNQATFQKTGGSRRSWFEAIDRPAMRPLPDQRFEYAEFARVRVGPDGRFTYQDCIYSAPFALCNKEIDIRASSATVELLHQSKRVASHVRASPGAPPTIDPLHMTSAHRYFASWSSDSAIATASEFGEHVGTFMQSLLEGITVKELGYRATIGLRKMVTEFGADRMNAACAVALRTPPASLSTLRFILRSNLDRLPNADHDDEDHIDHENIRGADYYR